MGVFRLTGGFLCVDRSSLVESFVWLTPFLCLTDGNLNGNDPANKKLACRHYCSKIHRLIDETPCIHVDGSVAKVFGRIANVLRKCCESVAKVWGGLISAKQTDTENEEIMDEPSRNIENKTEHKETKERTTDPQNQEKSLVLVFLYCDFVWEASDNADGGCSLLMHFPTTAHQLLSRCIAVKKS